MCDDKDLVLIFSINDVKYAIGIKDLVEVKEGSKLLSRSKDEGSLGRIAFRGGSIPLLDIKKRLALPSDAETDAGIVVAKAGDHVIAFPVDTVEGVMDVHGDPITFPDVMLKEKGLFSYVYIRNGEFVFSLNVSGLFDQGFIASLNSEEDGES